MTTKVSFTLPAELVGGASAGVLLGEFNNWNPEEGVYLQKQDDGSMMAELALTAGRTYEYRYLLNDGRWVNDHNQKKAAGGYGHEVENCLVAVPAIEEKIITKKTRTVKKVKEITLASDDLSKIEGINKKVSVLLNNEGIRSYKDLGKCTIKKLQLILDGAGSKFSDHNPATWPKQAKLAASGKWDELIKWQEEIKTIK